MFYDWFQRGMIFIHVYVESVMRVVTTQKEQVEFLYHSVPYLSK